MDFFSILICIFAVKYKLKTFIIYSFFMKRIGFSFLLMLLTITVTAQTARKFTVDITSDGTAHLTAYLPELPLGRAVVGCPGGGYANLSMQNEGHDWATFFNEQGIAYFVLKYRMPNGNREIPLSDARQAIRMVRDSAAQWGVNPYDVGIMGFSAGGHLASSVSTHSDFGSRPDFSILFYPVISMNERETHRGSVQNFLGEEGKKNEKLVKEWSNQNAVRSHLTPPAIVLSTSDDRVVPVLTNGLQYYSSMRRAGNNCALYIYPTGGHGFGMNPKFLYHEQMLGDLKTWLSNLPSPKADAIRVACIGNSITHGSGIDMQELRAYPAKLQRLLGSDYHVRNFGVGGRTMLQQGDHPYMKELTWKDAQAFDPDIVVIKLGTNDSKDYNWNAHKAEFETDYQAMIDTLCPLQPVLNKKGKPTKKMKRADRPRIYLCTPVKAFRDKWGITDSVIVNEVIPAVHRVAERNGLSVIDLHPVITSERDMTSDMIHPNETGAAKMAAVVADAIRK